MMTVSTIKKRVALLLIAFAILSAVLIRGTSACGGLFCTTSPINQNAERIIFSQNADDTTSAIIQINYTGVAEEFSWILPVKTEITLDNLDVVTDGMALFTEIAQTTTPQYIAPPIPDECWAFVPIAMADFGAESTDGVTIVDQGEVGPYNVAVLDSTDPEMLASWLRDNGYTLEESMEPLLATYVNEGFYFIAMKLQADKDVIDIDPVKLTYNSPTPMIPLRLTAVASNPNMPVMVWFFAEEQAKPTNYEHLYIQDHDVSVFTWGGNNYFQVLNDKIDQYDGRAFVTEYALPTADVEFAHPTLQQLGNDHAFLTRLYGIMDADQMTLDPEFEYDGSLPNWSNIHDFSKVQKWECVTEPEIPGEPIPFEEPVMVALASADLAVPADVNCDNKTSLIDAILIQRHNVGLIDLTPSCSLASTNMAVLENACDQNMDGQCGLIDALIILQCDAAIENQYCR